MSGRRRRFEAPLRGLLLLVCLVTVAAAGTDPIRPGSAAVASAHPLATAAGFEVLDAGGNAFDAAVAVAAALAVVEPYGSGLGGGGFWLLHEAAGDRQVMIDGRERAPLAATEDMFLDADGEVMPRLSLDGPLAAGIPGTPAALEHLARRYGRLPLRRSLAPAVALARDGFTVDEPYRRLAAFRLPALRASPAAAEIFLYQGQVPPAGHRIRQSALADLLRAIGESGAAAFYQGTYAARLVAGVRDAGGIWQLEDLAAYRVVERQPVIGRLGGFRVVSAAPPSSGGLLLAQMLKVIDRLEWDAADDTQRIHLLIEAMRRAYRDRALYLGDPDHFDVPQADLVSDDHVDALVASIDPRQATPSDRLPPVDVRSAGGRSTTHYSILDTDGNRVAATLSINYPFGSGFVVPGSGLLLNDEMDDFSIKPSEPNAYGLIGGAANAIAPGKRMLSSMSPTFVEGPDRIGILGTPGGSRIITMVMHGLLRFIDGAPAADMVAAPRFHHQYVPDVVQYEQGALSADQLARLEGRGHRFEVQQRGFGNMQAITWELHSGRVDAASDPRGIGAAIVRPPRQRVGE